MLLFQHNIGDIAAECVDRPSVGRALRVDAIGENDERDAAFDVTDNARPRESRLAEGVRSGVSPHE